jgi:hypothetical protein
MWQYYNCLVISPGENQSAHDDRMRLLGDEGWEMCGVGALVNQTHYRMFFKRLKRKEA